MSDQTDNYTGGPADDPTFRTALVTGAAHRIGRHIALALAREGWAVALHYNKSKDAAEALAREINDAGGLAQVVGADLAVEAEVQSLIDRVSDVLGPVSVLVNNASVFENDTIDTATRESWDQHMQVNLRSPFVLMQALSNHLPPHMEGNIINVLDQRVWNVTPFFTSYTLSKVGLWTLTQSLALALAPKIRVNAIGPGPTLRSQRQTEESFNAQWLSTPMGRQVMPEEIAEAVLFLLHAPSMTGQMLALDGGQHLGWGQVSNLEPPSE